MIYFPYSLDVLNHGAELGNVTHWTQLQTLNILAVQSDTGGALPFEGQYFFTFGVANNARSGQTVSIPHALHGFIDGGRCEITVSAMQAGNPAKNDTGSLYAVCLNASLSPLSTKFLEQSNPGIAWTQRSVTMRMPEGTRYVMLEVRGNLGDLAGLDSYWDDFHAEINLALDHHRAIYLSSAPSTSGWTQVSGTLAAKAFHLDPWPSAETVLYWSASAAGEHYRDIAIDADYVAAVDSGSLSALLEFLQTGDGSDTGRAYLKFFDGSSVQVGATIYSDVAHVAAPTTRAPKSIAGAVPATTRTVRIGIEGTRANGSDLDAHFSRFALFLIGEFPDATTEVTRASVSSLVAYGATAQIMRASVSSLVALAAALRITRAGVSSLVGRAPCATRRCDLWTIRRLDGVVLRFTSHDEPVFYGNDTFSPCHSLQQGASESAADAGSVGNLEVIGVINDAAVSGKDLFAGLFDGATIEAWRVTWDPDIPESPRRLLAGVIGNVRFTDVGWTCELLGDGARFQQTPLLKMFTAQCRWDRVGSPECGVDIDSYAVDGVVVEGLGQRSFIDPGLTQEAGYFNFGRILWTSGMNEGVEVEVRSHEAGGEIELWPRLANPITPYDTFTIWPGCDQLPTTCKTKFDNYLRYGGFEHVPGEDALAETPNDKD